MLLAAEAYRIVPLPNRGPIFIPSEGTKKISRFFGHPPIFFVPSEGIKILAAKPVPPKPP
jgi:hypothetical protein